MSDIKITIPMPDAVDVPARDSFSELLQKEFKPRGAGPAPVEKAYEKGWKDPTKYLYQHGDKRRLYSPEKDAVILEAWDSDLREWVQVAWMARSWDAFEARKTSYETRRLVGSSALCYVCLRPECSWSIRGAT